MRFKSRKGLITSWSIMLSCMLILVGCDRPWGWKQAPAIESPYRAADLEGLALIVIDTGQSYAFEVQCTQPGSYTDVKVSMNRVVGVQQAALKQAKPPKPILLGGLSEVDCSTDTTTVLHGDLVPHQPNRVGEGIDVHFEARRSDAEQPLSKITGIYEIGTDGKLRAGMGTVWR